jgi:hypothetical protein
MLRITVTAETSAAPEQVLAVAGTDFSSDQARVWPNVTTRKLEVHERGATFAEVTERGTGIARWFWERSRYGWSEPGTVKQTVSPPTSSSLARGGSSAWLPPTAAAARWR